MADSLIELGPVRDELRHQLLLDRLAFVLGVATEVDKPLGILSNDLLVNGWRVTSSAVIRIERTPGRPAARATGPLAKARWAGLRYVFRLSRVTIGPVARDWRKFPNWLGRIENSQAGNAETWKNAGRTETGNFENPKSVVWEKSQVFNPERD